MEKSKVLAINIDRLKNKIFGSEWMALKYFFSIKKITF